MILKHSENDSYLFDGPNNFQLSRGMEVVPLLSQKKAEISSDISTCYVGPHYAMWHGKALVYWYGMCHTVPRVKYHPSGFPSGISTTRSTQWTMKSLKIILQYILYIIVKISTFWYFSLTCKFVIHVHKRRLPVICINFLSETHVYRIYSVYIVSMLVSGRVNSVPLVVMQITVW